MTERPVGNDYEEGFRHGLTRALEVARREHGKLAGSPATMNEYASGARDVVDAIEKVLSSAK